MVSLQKWLAHFLLKHQQKHFFSQICISDLWFKSIIVNRAMPYLPAARVAWVHLNFRTGSTFPVPVCTVSPGHWVNKKQTLNRTTYSTRLTRSDFRLNLFLLKGQRCGKYIQSYSSLIVFISSCSVEPSVLIVMGGGLKILSL